jgi:cytochrome c oxidase subunit 4
MSEHARSEKAAAAQGAAHRASYAAVFGVLGVLTLVELGVARTPGIPKTAVVVALVTLAIAKAALIALFYMHLRFETGILRLTVLAPLVAPGVYGLILIVEAGARAMR